MTIIDLVRSSILTCLPVALFAQDPAQLDLTFNPADTGFGEFAAYEGNYDLMVPAPDGTVLVGKKNNSWSATPYTLYRLLPNGALDPSFQLNIASDLSCLTVQPDGKILVGVQYQSSWPYAKYLMRLNVDGTLDTSFQLDGNGLDGRVHDVFVQSSGEIVIGGDFSTIGEAERPMLAKLTSNGGLMDPVYWNFTGNAEFYLDYLDAVQLSDGSLVAFATAFGSANTIYRFTADGVYDPDFVLQSDWDDLELLTDRPQALLADGQGGFYMACRTVADPYIQTYTVHFLPDGSLDTQFMTTYRGQTVSISHMPNGGLFLSGSIVNTFDGNIRQGYVAVNSTGDVNAAFPTDHLIDSLILINPNEQQLIKSTVLPDGRVLLSSEVYTMDNGSYRNRTVCLLPNGDVDVTFRPITAANGPVHCMVQLEDGRMLLGGAFTSYYGHPTRYLVRIFEDGSIDASFDPGKVARAPVNALLREPDGGIVVGTDCISAGYYLESSTVFKIAEDGSFQYEMMPVIGEGQTACLGPGSIRSLQRVEQGRILAAGSEGLYRLLPDGGQDLSFDQGNGPNGPINDTQVMNDGNYLLGGEFDYWNSTAVRPNLNRVNLSGSVMGMPTNYSISGLGVKDLEMLPAGACMVCGDFAQAMWTINYGIIQINATAQITTFVSGLPHFIGNTCQRMKRLVNGQYLVAGHFSTFSGSAHNDLVRTSGLGVADPLFDAGSGFGGTAVVSVLDVDPQGRYLVAGDFTSYDGVGRNRIMRLIGDQLTTHVQEPETSSSSVLVLAQGDQLMLAGAGLPVGTTHSIIDGLGRRCWSGTAIPSQDALMIPTDGLAPGSYSVQFINASETHLAPLRFLVVSR
ncbi:MAG: delta-60 repeat domain-containing protein [Flavobacteriales bacterium]|nr:delta-60 repeat domain-containing protein [Flavobacteriales bacterium]